LLGGYFTQADVGTINRSGGTVKLNGFLENSGQTLDITASSPLDGLRMAGGTIHGGTVLGNAAANLFATDSSYGTLDSVTLHGNLDITGTGSYAIFTNGLSVKDSSGTNPGVVNVTGFGAYLYSQGTQTLDKATVHLGGSSGPGYIYSESGTLTLGADLHVLADGVGSYGQLYGAPIINEGSIAFTNGHYNNYINPSEFTNKGTITVAPATALYITPGTLTNTAAGSITGDDGSFIQFGGAAASNAGTITMNGAGGTTVLQMGYAGNPGNNPTYQWHKHRHDQRHRHRSVAGRLFHAGRRRHDQPQRWHGEAQRLPREQRPDAGHYREFAARRIAHGRRHDSRWHRPRQRRRQPVCHRLQLWHAGQRHPARQPGCHRYLCLRGLRQRPERQGQQRHQPGRDQRHGCSAPTCIRRARRRSTTRRCTSVAARVPVTFIRKAER
jgi:hypothetical protein